MDVLRIKTKTNKKIQLLILKNEAFFTLLIITKEARMIFPPRLCLRQKRLNDHFQTISDLFRPPSVEKLAEASRVF